uniref:Uncharacterized protein n=1 Tax=Setaria italica TaxID=4555 RepID=K3YBM0_SETIT
MRAAYCCIATQQEGCAGPVGLGCTATDLLFLRAASAILVRLVAVMWLWIACNW